MSRKQIKKKGLEEDLTGKSCEVCQTALDKFPNFQRVSCKDCGRMMHRNCYRPVPFEKKSFRCDMCLKKYEGCCTICKASSGVMRELHNGEFAHVLCALVSPRIQLVSYRTLEFKFEHEKPIENLKRCFICKIESFESVKCAIPKCAKYAHINCVLNCVLNESAASEVYPIYNLLKKSSNCLLAYLSEEDFPQLKSLRHNISCSLFVCCDHSASPDFEWCLCEKNLEGELLECDKCGGWSHHPKCTKGAVAADKYICDGCISKDIFNRASLLPELITKMGDLEESLQLNPEHLQFIDCFPFKISKRFSKIIQEKKVHDAIETYYLSKVLQKYLLAMDLDDKKKIEEVFPLLYYFFKRETSPKINLENLRMCQREFADKSKNWSFHQPKLQVKYRKMVEEYLKKHEKKDAKGLQQKLEAFNRKYGFFRKKRIDEFVVDLKEVVELMGQNEEFGVFLGQLADKCLSMKFFDLLMRSRVSKEQLTVFLQSIGKVLKCKAVGVVNECEYFNLLNVKMEEIDAEGRRSLNEFLRRLLNSFGIKREYDYKNDLLKTKEAEGGKSGMRELIQQGVYIDANSQIVQHQMLEIKYQLLKRKCLKALKVPTLNGMELIRSILALKQMKGKLVMISQEEDAIFSAFQAKHNFYAALVERAEAQNLHHVLEDPDNLCANKGMKALEKWRMLNIDINFGMEQLSKLQGKGLIFSEEQFVLIRCFSDGILSKVCSSEYLLNFKAIEKITKIIELAELGAKYQEVLQKKTNFERWMGKCEGSLRGVSIALESKECIECVESFLWQAKVESQEIKMDMSSELRKLQVVKVWCEISKKFLVEGKPTIGGIQQIKALAERILYPKNQIYRQIKELDAEAQILNKKINLFLDRSKKVSLDLEIFQELLHNTTKMSREDAEDLLIKLQRSSLDVADEQQELEEELKQFKKIPRDILDRIRLASSSEELMSIRKKMLESPFRYESNEAYDALIRRIYFLKCGEYDESNVSRKEYFRMLNLGGPASLELFNRTQGLFKAYKQIDRAERQFFSSKNKYENLLPADQKQMKDDLRGDVTELAQIEKFYQTGKKLKDKFLRLYKSRGRISDFMALEQQLLKVPINFRDTQQEIALIKRTHEQLLDKANRYLMEVDYSSEYSAELIRKYAEQPFRSEKLDRYEALVLAFKSIVDMNVTFDNYADFSRQCELYPELAASSIVNSLRRTTFMRIYGQIGKEDSTPEICRVLMAEGGRLCSQALNAGEYLPCLLKINEILRNNEQNESPNQSIEESSSNLDMIRQRYSDDVVEIDE